MVGCGSVSEAAALEKHTAHLHLLSPSTSLHPHQVVALKWLANLWDKVRNISFDWLLRL
jgi:hypothetical protein